MKPNLEGIQPSPSTGTPPPGLLLSLHLFIADCRCHISPLDISAHLTDSNLTPSERSAPHCLCTNPDILIKPADKGGAVAVWRTDLSLAEARNQLSDSSSLLPLNHDPTEDHQDMISSTITDLVTSGDLPPTATNMIVQQLMTACFYLLPKIHKKDCPGKAIVSTRTCPMELVSSYLDTILFTLPQSLPTYVCDTSHALQLFCSFKFSGMHNHIFTMDVQSLCTSIHHLDDFP
ncbi:uncharacterized protein LOC127581143 [Pristis pectinata]|uniref:uncharacterized protein LOC127581143 n=1 Tax=Pristis pectinata TaxID=685728 RepID=UPI00223D459D|nr:uncharacterized protein LOC127581143 [Pristis pectinata]